MGDKGKKEQKKKKKVKLPVSKEVTISTVLNPLTVPNKTNPPKK